MRAMSRTSRWITLGDAVASAFERAERSGGGAAAVAVRASRDLEARLRRAGRRDLIQRLRGMDEPAGLAGEGTAVGAPRAKPPAIVHAYGPYAAAG